MQDSWGTTLRLAFQCVGILYGDVGTSPLYVYSTTFGHGGDGGGVGHPDDILGVLSLIIYSFVLFTVIKIVVVALHANDDGDGTVRSLYI
jgi:KUP system potassium uptake protein